jgi:hypothetical protein
MAPSSMISSCRPRALRPESLSCRRVGRTGDPGPHARPSAGSRPWPGRRCAAPRRVAEARCCCSRALRPGAPASGARLPRGLGGREDFPAPSAEVCAIAATRAALPRRAPAAEPAVDGTARRACAAGGGLVRRPLAVRLGSDVAALFARVGAHFLVAWLSLAVRCTGSSAAAVSALTDFIERARAGVATWKHLLTPSCGLSRRRSRPASSRAAPPSRRCRRGRLCFALSTFLYLSYATALRTFRFQWDNLLLEWNARARSSATGPRPRPFPVPRCSSQYFESASLWQPPLGDCRRQRHDLLRRRRCRRHWPGSRTTLRPGGTTSRAAGRSSWSWCCRSRSSGPDGCGSSPPSV